MLLPVLLPVLLLLLLLLLLRIAIRCAGEDAPSVIFLSVMCMLDLSTSQPCCLLAAAVAVAAFRWAGEEVPSVISIL
jgi:hypothetical protein